MTAELQCTSAVLKASLLLATATKAQQFGAEGHGNITLKAEKLEDGKYRPPRRLLSSQAPRLAGATATSGTLERVISTYKVLPNLFKTIAIANL